MKKIIPYIIVAAVVGMLIFLVATTTVKHKRVLDERITLREKDKIPYGMLVAKKLLPGLFPSVIVQYENREPGFSDYINSEDSAQALVLVASYFNADKMELNHLMDFTRKGNYVFIIARTYSYNAMKFFHIGDDSYAMNQLDDSSDSLKVRLENAVFSSDTLFSYPGKRFAGSISSLDSLHTIVLGRNENGWPDFIQLNNGQGSIFIHSAPLAFSNYFILHKNNILYYESAFSVIPKNVHTIVWNEYYMLKPSRNDEEPGWLTIMLKHEAFRWGFYTGIVLLALFLLLNMRRRQRMIPAHEKPKNDSLDFIKTLGRLYYDRKDHKNLAIKMGQYFLEHVRANYKLATHTLDEKFIETLYFKTAYPLDELKRIISFINNLDAAPMISEIQLSEFHKQLELFYQNT